MSGTTVGYVLAGLAALAAGGEVLVRGATGLARSFGIPAFVVGLLIVSVATSAPELAVTLQAALDGSPGMAVGNVVGSNIANILLILGICAVALPLTVHSQLIRIDIPVTIAFSGLVLVLALDGLLGRVDGAVFVIGLVVYAVATIAIARRRSWGTQVSYSEQTGGPDQAGANVTVPDQAGAKATVPDQAGAKVTVSVPAARRRPLLALGLVAAGVAMLVVGAKLLVTGATDAAVAMGVSDLVIGLTVVAVGTSLPELAASVVAVARGQRDLAVGNLVGSCLFNIGAVLGIAGIIAPDGVPVVPAAIRLDLPIMIAVALTLVPVAFTGYAITRWEGAMFVAFYAAYVTYTLLDATGHDAVDPFSGVMLGFVIPITGVWLALLVGYEFGVRRKRRSANLSGLADAVEGRLER
jgi:cation:H+ antiporter